MSNEPYRDTAPEVTGDSFGGEIFVQPTSSDPPPAVKMQAGVSQVPVYQNIGLVIDWIDSSNSINIQILRRSDGLVYNSASANFVAEANAPGGGLIPLVRDASPLRNAYQSIEIPTPPGFFLDGFYRIFYFGANNALIEACGFGVYRGMPFYEGSLPANSIPQPGDIVTAITPIIPKDWQVAAKVLDADNRNHKQPNSLGLAANKILGNV